MGDCETCPLYQAAEKFCATSVPRTRPTAEADYTVPGKLIAAGARAKGLALRDVSTKIGRAPDYLTRVCRGKLALNGATAYAVGQLLGIGLEPYVGHEPGIDPLVPSDPEPGLPLRFDHVTDCRCVSGVEP